MVSVSVTRARLSGRAPLYPYYSAASAESCSRRPMRLARADGARLCIASPGGGRSPCLSGPCQCPFLDGGPAHSGHSQDIGVDFALRFGFAQNNQKNIAGCDTRASHSAIAGLRKVQHGSFAPCDSLTSHLATSRYRTLPLSPVAPCDSKSQLSAPKNRFLRSLLGGRADGSGFSKPDINAPFGMRRLAPPPTPHLARNVEIAIISKPTPGACPPRFCRLADRRCRRVRTNRRRHRNAATAKCEASAIKTKPDEGKSRYKKPPNKTARRREKATLAKRWKGYATHSPPQITRTKKSKLSH